MKSPIEHQLRGPNLSDFNAHTLTCSRRGLLLTPDTLKENTRVTWGSLIIMLGKGLSLVGETFILVSDEEVYRISFKYGKWTEPENIEINVTASILSPSSNRKENVEWIYRTWLREFKQDLTLLNSLLRDRFESCIKFGRLNMEMDDPKYTPNILKMKIVRSFSEKIVDVCLRRKFVFTDNKEFVEVLYKLVNSKNKKVKMILDLEDVPGGPVKLIMKRKGFSLFYEFEEFKVQHHDVTRIYRNPHEQLLTKIRLSVDKYVIIPIREKGNIQ